MLYLCIRISSNFFRIKKQKLTWIKNNLEKTVYNPVSILVGCPILGYKLIENCMEFWARLPKALGYWCILPCAMNSNSLPVSTQKSSIHFCSNTLITERGLNRLMGLKSPLAV